MKTIVNLRGESTSGAWLFEVESSAQAGVELIPFRMSSRGAPSAKRVLDLAHLIADVDRPVLFHCKSGADRSGFAAGVYLLVSEAGDVTAAKAQLSWKYLHFKGASTGMLDEFFCEYERYLARESRAHSREIFLSWVRHVYDADALKRQFKPDGLVTWLVDKVLRRE
ncbi:MAG: tyrosine-protein phosphatase [Natronospirillum sp.]